MVTKEALAGLVITLVIAPLTVFILYQYGVIHDLLSVIDQIIAGAIAAVIFGGILLFVHGIIKEKESNDFYSPIHDMILKIKDVIPRRLEVTKWVTIEESKVDYKNVSSTFTNYATKFKGKDNHNWNELLKQITAPINGGGFFVGPDTQEWFDDLENRYCRKNRRSILSLLLKHLRFV